MTIPRADPNGRRFAWPPAGGRGRVLGVVVAAPLIALLVLPVVALVLSSSVPGLWAGFSHPLFARALGLSALTTIASLLIVVVTGTPLAWWLASTTSRRARMVELLVDVPVVLPPAVVGIGLLLAFGRGGIFGAQLEAMDLQIPFTTTAVVLAQVTVSAPFYVQSAAAAFRAVDDDLLLVARSLGETPAGAFLRVAVPLARPGLVGGAALAWARALGEFGATLLFAGNLPGRTQTMPLAVYTTLESDVRGALALALVLAAASVGLLMVLRLAPSFSAAGSAAGVWRARAARDDTARFGGGGGSA